MATGGGAAGMMLISQAKRRARPYVFTVVGIRRLIIDSDKTSQNYTKTPSAQRAIFTCYL